MPLSPNPTLGKSRALTGENILEGLMLPSPDPIPRFLLTGPSGELGMLRPIKIEPEDLDIIQVTVPGKEGHTGGVSQ